MIIIECRCHIKNEWCPLHDCTCTQIEDENCPIHRIKPARYYKDQDEL